MHRLANGLTNLKLLPPALTLACMQLHCTFVDCSTWIFLSLAYQSQD